MKPTDLAFADCPARQADATRCCQVVCASVAGVNGTNCTPQAEDELARKSYTVKKGQQLFQEGELPTGLYAIAQGNVKLFKTEYDGKEQIIRLAGPGQFLGYRALIADEPYVNSATMLTDGMVCYIPRAAFLQALAQDPNLSQFFLKSLAQDMGVAAERLITMSRKSVRERVAEMLLLLAEAFPSHHHGKVEIDLSLPREDLANLVGTATESVIRLLSEFRDDQFIELEGRRIRILNAERLRKIAHVDEARPLR